jgi:hypothetical protein
MTYHFGFTSYPPTVMQYATFAPRWFEDAYAESGLDGADARRREIIFSVFFAESYIFEWVRGMNGCPVNKYFPPGNYRNVLDKWKIIPEELYKDGLIREKPELDFSQLGTLKNYRDGLAHASASRPRISGQGKKEKPIPSMNILNKLPRGWAVKIVVNLVRRLHKDIDQSPPNYIRLPESPPQSSPPPTQ